MQGDIVAVYDGNGTKYGEYAYDAWGKCSIIYDKDGIATKNPYRYRGYYLDKETDLYYLNSRYYDPEVGRFLSADSLGYMDPERVNGLNLYAYCNNNPVMYIDPDGTEVVILSIFALLALLVSAVAVLAILDFEYRTHTIRDLFVSVGDVFGNIFNGISDFFTSFVNAKNVSLPGLDYGGYTIGNIVFDRNKGKPGRPGIKGKGKEELEKKKNNKKWKRRNPKRGVEEDVVRPKAHTPGKAHRNKGIHPLKKKLNLILLLLKIDLISDEYLDSD